MNQMDQIIYKILLYKVKGGALQYTIVFSLLIMLSLLLYLMFIRFSAFEIYQLQKQSQLIENINSATVILENHPELFDNVEHNMFLTEDSTYMTNIKISKWGFYYNVKISVQQGKQQLSKLFLFTDNIQKYSLPSLYLSGINQYLSLGGNAYIGNNTFLPSNGIRESYIDGVGYNRDSLIQGASYEADATLPELNKFWKERYNNINDNIVSTINYNSLSQDSIFMSFNDQTLILNYPHNYQIKNKYLKGNIIITGTKLRISNTSSIHQCIIKADSILIENDFKGEVQLIADKYVEIGESSVLMPPSIIYLKNSKNNEQIKMKSNTMFIGEIIIPNYSDNRHVLLAIENGVQLIGQIYCNGYSSFEGTLFGSYYCGGFLKKTKTGMYENYLIDVCINSKRLPEDYCGVSLIEKSYAKVCAEEIY